jgi:hypothetical protein
MLISPTGDLRAPRPPLETKGTKGSCNGTHTMDANAVVLETEINIGLNMKEKDGAVPLFRACNALSQTATHCVSTR